MIPTIQTVSGQGVPEYGQMRSAVFGSCPYWVIDRLGVVAFRICKHLTGPFKVVPEN